MEYLPVWLHTEKVSGWFGLDQTQTGGGRAAREQKAAHSFSQTLLNCQKERKIEL